MPHQQNCLTGNWPCRYFQPWQASKLVSSLKIEGYHDDHFIVIGGTRGCRYDSLRCRKGRQSWHNDSLGFHTQWSYCHSLEKLLTKNKYRFQLTLPILQDNHLFHRMLFPLQLMSCLRLYCQYTEQVMWPIELLMILYFLFCFDRGLIHTAVQWWRHQMETFSALPALCAGISPVTGEFPSQRPVTRRFDVFFDLHLNKGLSKQSWGWWFETQSCLLWRHCNAIPSRVKWS